MDKVQAGMFSMRSAARGVPPSARASARNRAERRATSAHDDWHLTVASGTPLGAHVDAVLEQGEACGGRAGSFAVGNGLQGQVVQRAGGQPRGSLDGFVDAVLVEECASRTSAQSLRRVRSARSADTLWLLTVVPVRRVAARIEVVLPASRQATVRSSSTR
ncbi:hypothetical protein ACFWNT_02170 [Streptomyces sp. NPDC058409]|uniref:hypothetical protein n=1 Tax=Streptomyces sp. NPDC058409 TaxID=3346484 RepID=UPI00365792C3